MISLNKIIKFISFAIIPLGTALFLSLYSIGDNSYQEAVMQTVAAIIGMIPEGLILLTSTVLAVSVIRLSKSKVLVQELYCIETLARVDTLCLDKTGTLTQGSMKVNDFVPIDFEKNELYNILANISCISDDENPTINAIKDFFKIIDSKFDIKKKIAFSSLTKCSSFSFNNIGTYTLGAPEFILKDDYIKYEKDIAKYIDNYRVIGITYSKDMIENNVLPISNKLIGLILISDKIRKDANKTIDYFYNQNVDIKIISGDNPITVSKIAKQVGVKNYDSYFDMSKSNSYDDLEKIVSKYTVFGRVSPIQKQSLIIALKKLNKTVAMTGDGVNDVLSLKEADCSIAMASGSDASKNVSQLVLLNSDFSSIPNIVLEGRRTINNIQRSAMLFLVKTIYSLLLACIFLFVREDYPFIPIQLTLIGMFTIGIPSFLLALEPNKEMVKGKFLKNVISKALPCGLTVVINIVFLIILNKLYNLDDNVFSSLCVFSTGILGLILLFTISKSTKSENSKLPFSIYRLLVSCIMSLLFIFGLVFFKDLFNIVDLNNISNYILPLIFVSILTFAILNFGFYRGFKIGKN